MSGRALCVFLRAPELGQVKTRLAATIGEAAALRLYEAFLDDAVAVAADAASQRGAELELTVAGPVDHPRLAAAATAHRAKIVSQATGDLGVRMGAAIDRHLTAGRAVCIVGSDSPQLTSAQITRGFDALVDNEVVIGPSRDGGYWLLGTRRPVPELLVDVAWSTSEVLSTTLARLAGRSPALLEMSFDVDEAEDLDLLRRWLAVAPPEIAPATRRALVVA